MLSKQTRDELQELRDGLIEALRDEYGNDREGKESDSRHQVVRACFEILYYIQPRRTDEV